MRTSGDTALLDAAIVAMQAEMGHVALNKSAPIGGRDGAKGTTAFTASVTGERP